MLPNKLRRIPILPRRPIKPTPVEVRMLDRPRISARTGIHRTRVNPLRLARNRERITSPRDDFTACAHLLGAPGQIGGVIGGESQRWLCEAVVIELAAFAELVGARHGGESVLEACVVGHGGAVFGHLGEVASCFVSNEVLVFGVLKALDVWSETMKSERSEAKVL
ncbi:hypothetical protein GB937_000841 [Aspergillus fischeri]|nr:hypothetical protein GB937_000841 [Aspergillus fischeri]